MNHDTYDIAILGAGPAGSTLARLLSDRYRVLLIERRNMAELDGRLTKACGALIAPDAQEMLASMGLGLPKDVLVGPQLFGVRALDLQTRQEGHYLRHYINTDRERFDRWLFSLVPEGVEKRLSTHLVSAAASRQNGIYQLQLRQGTTHFDVSARVVVGADGARSKIRSLLAPPWAHPPKEYVAIQEWYELDAPQAHFGVFFDSDLTDFYGWSIPKENALILGLALSPSPNAAQQFQVFKSRLTEQGFSFGRLLRREAHPILRPRFLTSMAPNPEGLLLIGEAGALISPSSAEGFSYAFKSALAAAKALNSDLVGAELRYRDYLKDLRWHLRMKSVKSPMMYQPYLRRLILASGVKQLA